MLRPTSSHALEALLAAFARCRTPEARARIAEALVRTGSKDERIRAALVRMLEDDPLSATENLAAYGDARALVDLTAALDRLALAPVADCEVCAAQHLVGIQAAIEVLGGTISEAQQTRIDDALERAHEKWIPLDGPFEVPPEVYAPAWRKRRLPRNAPCHCGSGKKYKRCHLDADEASARH